MATTMEAGTAYLGGLLWLPKELVDLRLLRSSLTFTPMSTSKLAKNEPIRAWADDVHHIGVPRYLWGPVNGQVFHQRFTDFGVPLVDLRPTTYEPIAIQSRVVLDAVQHSNVQKQAVDVLLKSDAGILQIACGYGKTVIALHAAAQFRVPFIIIVDSTGAQAQWAEEVARHLRMDDGTRVSVGLVGDGYSQWDRPVVIALVQSLYKLAKTGKMPEGMRRKFGIAIFDEAHIMGAREFANAAPLFFGRRWGLTATPKRPDGLERMYYLHLGPPVMTYLKQELRPSFYFYRVQYQIDPADPQFKAHVMLHGQINVPLLYTYLAGIIPRTYEIVLLVRQGAEQGRKIMVLSNRRYMLQQLKSLLPEAGVIHGDIKGQRRRDVTKASSILLSQFRLGEKSLDKRELDMLIVCEPFRWSGSFQQVVGRLQRMMPGKLQPIVVFIEDRVGPCIHMCSRLRQLISTWPAEQGGPYIWKFLGGQDQTEEDRRRMR